MVTIPAVCVKNKKCKPVIKDSVTKNINSNPFEAALYLQKQGEEWLYFVDMDGAEKDYKKKYEVIKKIITFTNLKIMLDDEVGNLESIEYYIDNGVSRVVLGSAAVINPRIIIDSVKKFGDKIVVKIESKTNVQDTNDWLYDMNMDCVRLAMIIEALGVEHIMLTNNLNFINNIRPNLQELFELNKAVKCNIISRSGIHTKDDIFALEQFGLNSVIC